jgi:quinol monooxygenase YgiN
MTMRKRSCATAVALAFGVFSLAALPEISVADESIAVIAHFHVAPGREAEAEARLRKVVEFVRMAEPGITYRLYRSQKDPSVFVFYEVYPSMTAIEQHRKVTLPAFLKQFGKAPQGLFSGPPEVERMQALVN